MVTKSQQSTFIIIGIVLAALLITGTFTGLLDKVGLSAVTAPACFTTGVGMKEITPVCTGGTITSDVIIVGDGCRLITCRSDAGQEMVAKACNKPGDFTPSYFEMYVHNFTSQPVTTKVCLDTTCVGTNSGFSISPTFQTCAAQPVCPAGSTGTYPGCTCTGTSTYQSTTNSCVAQQQSCPSGASGTYPSCVCASGQTYNSATNVCVTPASISFISTAPAQSAFTAAPYDVTQFNVNVNSAGLATTRSWAVNGLASAGNLDDFWWSAPTTAGTYNIVATVVSPVNTISKTWTVTVNAQQQATTQCPSGSTGTHPACLCGTGLVYQSSTNTCVTQQVTQCPSGTSGTYPNCACSSGYSFNVTTNVCVAQPVTNTTTSNQTIVIVYQNVTTTSVPTQAAGQAVTSAPSGSGYESYVWPIVAVLALLAAFGGDKKKKK